MWTCIFHTTDYIHNKWLVLYDRIIPRPLLLVISLMIYDTDELCYLYADFRPRDLESMPLLHIRA
jgi:hypothetical protein